MTTVGEIIMISSLARKYPLQKVLLLYKNHQRNVVAKWRSSEWSKAGIRTQTFGDSDCLYIKNPNGKGWFCIEKFGTVLTCDIIQGIPVQTIPSPEIIRFACDIYAFFSSPQKTLQELFN